MQIIELYIRDGVVTQPAAATSTSTNNLIDSGASFTSTVEVGYIVFNEKNGTSAKVTAITNDTTLVLSESTDGSNFFTVGEQYTIKSDFKRLDLFEDESVSITDSIKNVRDVAKIFTPFSQQFNVPASKHNAKIFRHYEDQDIINSFDARYKVDALIKLNGTDYKKGKIKLSSVSLKNNKPHAYKLIFFGETIELKDILGEGMLSDLTFPSNLNFAYNHTTILDKFINLSDVCFPLITHTKNMRYNTNVYRSITPVADQKLNYRDIKPAIKVRKIIDAIETTYPDIDFTGEFFNTEDFSNLYLWMHREKGFMSNAPEGGGLNVLRGHFHLPDDTDANLSLSSGIEMRPLSGSSGDIIFGGGVNSLLTFNITTASAASTFNLRVYFSSITIGELDFTLPETNIINQEFTGATSYSVSHNFGSSLVNVFIEVTSTNSFNIQTFEIVASKTGGGSGTYTLDSLSVANTVEINRQMPKIKTFDFITNLFKMFNLVAYKEGTQIRVLPLNDFYDEGVSYNITKYVDTTKNSISKVLQFKNFNFNFKSKKSYLVEKSDELQADNFGGSDLGLPQGDGGDYKIELDFEKMMYERLSDENPSSGALTTIGQGAMLDKDFNATIGKPLLLYIVNQAATPNFLFANADGGSDETVATYNRPSQVFVSGGAVSDSSSALNFGLEQDEFFLEPKGTNLLKKYYLNYVASVFHPQARINKVEAYLPLHIILNYELNDRFIIGNKPYRINSIKTNLLNNKSSLELYSLSQEITAIENSQSSALPRLASISIAGKGTTFVTLGWTPLSDPVANNITGYDIYKDDAFVETLGNDISGRTLTGLTSDITYKFAIRTRYTIGGVISFSNDRIVFATTDPAPTALAENGDTLITEGSDTIILE